MSYMPPKISEMTREELESKARAVGLPGMPYPMTHAAEVDGKIDIVLGGIEDASEPLAIVSPHLSIQDVNRIMYTQMATLEMLELSRHVMRATRPDVDNHLTMVLGEPSTGKTFELRKIFSLVHPEGALLVDCGGMDVGELIWRSTIDYGEGVREQLDARAENGTISPNTVALLKEQFAGSIVEKDGRVVINWSAIGELRG